MTLPKPIPITNKESIVIPIAHGFLEDVVTSIVCRLRDEGFKVWLVSISVGLIAGYHNLTFRPDRRLSQLKSTQPPSLVILPGAGICTHSLLANPAVYELIEDTFLNGGYVAVTRDAQPVLVRSGLSSRWDEKQVLHQDQQSIDTFVASMLNYLLA